MTLNLQTLAKIMESQHFEDVHLDSLLFKKKKKRYKRFFCLIVEHSGFMKHTVNKLDYFI